MVSFFLRVFRGWGTGGVGSAGVGGGGGGVGVEMEVEDVRCYYIEILHR